MTKLTRDPILLVIARDNLEAETRALAAGAVDFISLAKAQLQEAKRQGRNKVCGKELAGYFSNSLK